MNTNDFDAIVEKLAHDLRPLAYRYSQAFADLDVDDFLAIGLEGAAQAYDRTGKTDISYLYGAARNKIRQTFWTRSRKSVPTFSLDRYLYDGETDQERYIAEEHTTPLPQASAALKTRVDWLLSTLPEKHQQVLRACYHLDGADTVEEVCERYHLTPNDTFHDTTKRAIVMLQRNVQRQLVLGQ